MSIIDIFSKRQKLKTHGADDVFKYDEIPNAFKVQVIHITRDCLGITSPYSEVVNEVYGFIHNSLCREYGLFKLHKSAQTYEQSIFDFFLQTDNCNHALDVIELLFKVIAVKADDYNYRQYSSPKMDVAEAVEELNRRFKEHSLGYQFESNEIIRVDSLLIHKEIIKPALNILANKMFSGANEEFLKAHEHYRHGRNKEALVDALKSFESVMKAICVKKKWDFQATDTAKTLIDICIQKGLLSSFHQSQLTSVRTLLESGAPTVRNKLGGHGQGAEPVSVPNHLAKYAINVSATCILLLADSYEHLP